MGAKQTKFEGSYLPNTPVAQCKLSETVNMNFNETDPRSPAECRTPISVQTDLADTNMQFSCVDITENGHNNVKPLDVLRKRFLKTFSSNLNDPRSPSLNLNRTPIVFDDTLEKSLSLNDTFSNLFVESSLPKVLNKAFNTEETQNKFDDGSDVGAEKEKMIVELDENLVDPHNHIALQQDFDPRSPSIGVERTPIIFADEIDETVEDDMLENILATLCIDINSSAESSGVLSTNSQNEDFYFSNKINSKVVPVNKHLDRVRSGKKNFSKHLEQKKRRSHRKIYEDQENHMLLTPTLKESQGDISVYLRGRRTPLSCVRNRNDVHLRSRSVESSAKSIKTRLVLSSFDDSLNTTEN